MEAAVLVIVAAAAFLAGAYTERAGARVWGPAPRKGGRTGQKDTVDDPVPAPKWGDV